LTFADDLEVNMEPEFFFKDLTLIKVFLISKQT